MVKRGRKIDKVNWGIFLLSFSASIIFTEIICLIWYLLDKAIYYESHRTVTDNIVLCIVFTSVFILSYTAILTWGRLRKEISGQHKRDIKSYHEVTYRDFINVYPYNIVYKMLCGEYWTLESSKLSILSKVNPDGFESALEKFLSRDERVYIRSVYRDGISRNDLYKKVDITAREYRTLEEKILLKLSKKRVRDSYFMIPMEKYLSLESELDSLKDTCERMYSSSPERWRTVKMRINDFPIENLCMSEKVTDTLKSNGIHSVKDVKGMSVKALSEVNGLSVEGVAEVVGTLSSLGIKVY